MEWPTDFENAREIDIETRAGGDGTHRTTIWPVVADGQVYVRSLRGGVGRWYRELIASPDEAVVHLDGESVPVRAVVASDAESVEQATAGYRRKYGNSSALDSMIRDEILATTTRLEPLL